MFEEGSDITEGRRSEKGGGQEVLYRGVNEGEFFYLRRGDLR